MVGIEQRVLSAFKKLAPQLASTGKITAKPGSSGSGPAATTAAQWRVECGNKTYGVRLFSLDPPVPGVEQHRDLKEATQLLSDAGLTPRTIGWDKEAYVREWSGAPVLKTLDTKDDDASIETTSSLGDAFGRLHNIKVPKSWVPHPDISIKLEGMTHWAFGDDGEKHEYLDVIQMMANLENPTLMSNGHDIVLTHGDAKPGNVLQTDEGNSFMFIDLPTLGRRNAIEELSYVFFMWNAGTYSKTLTTLPEAENYVYFNKPTYRRAFVRSYLSSRKGREPTNEEINDLIWEIECHLPRTMIYIGIIMKFLSGQSSALNEELLAYANQCCHMFPQISKEGLSLLKIASQNEQKRQEIIELGLTSAIL